MPPQTLDAFRDHGHAVVTINKDLDKAGVLFGQLSQMGISIDEVTYQLEVEGVKAFAEAFAELLKTVEQRRMEAAAK